MRKPLKHLRLAPEELRIVLGYNSRCYKSAEVESEAFPVRKMLLHNPPPGKYIGLGDRIEKIRP